MTMVMAPLPTHITDPGERLAQVSAAMSRVKERFDPASARWLGELAASRPAAPTGLADRAAFALLGQAPPAINIIVSSIPGPQFPLYLAGARVPAHYPVSVVTDISGGLNITAFSYDGRVDVGLTACRAIVPTYGPSPALREVLGELTALADARG
ncbi:WSD1 family O-acyltransferase [Spongiactinospora sp. TRM90649]|uniref:WSD1 family O-acyltransferase n=1 Tax=Spongiactinospora sp. TRM90649 TaxID=3031114 RepID=UPI0023F71ED3|nr:WSD1 family O-acyltransferase [Spongiactinospora sp. TRM90649]MDF5756294.1 WSD1 family O-acyltransferase [Spongiactinospora sp. TRM90649]